MLGGVPRARAIRMRLCGFRQQRRCTRSEASHVRDRRQNLTQMCQTHRHRQNPPRIQTASANAASGIGASLFRSFLHTHSTTVQLKLVAVYSSTPCGVSDGSRHVGLSIQGTEAQAPQLTCAAAMLRVAHTAQMDI